MLKNILRKMKDIKGAALATVIGVFAVVSILGVSALSISLSQGNSSASIKNTTSAYYLARSAVNVVCKNINDQILALNTYKNAILVAQTPADKQTAITNYNAAIANFNSLKLVPTVVGTIDTVQVGGIYTDGTQIPVQVTLQNASSGKAVQVNCTAISGKNTASASARVANFSTASAYVTVPGSITSTFSWGNDAIYAWGDANFSGTPRSVTGFIAAGDTVTGYSGSNVIQHSPQTIPILLPPSSVMGINKTSMSSGSPKYIMTNGSKNGTATFNQSANGFYGDVSNSSGIDWNIDTSLGDVVFIFSSLSCDKDINIHVTGNHKFYLYIYETYIPGASPYAPTVLRPLMYAKNNCSISDSSGSGAPQTYIIVTNDYLQKYMCQNIGSNMIPLGQYTHTAAQMDTVEFKNGATMKALIYAPDVCFNIKNNADITGALFAGDVEINNNAIITLNVVQNELLFNGYVQTIPTGTDQKLSYTSYNFDISGGIVWLKG